MQPVAEAVECRFPHRLRGHRSCHRFRPERPRPRRAIAERIARALLGPSTSAVIRIVSTSSF